MKKQIEVTLPLMEINQASISDNVKKGHPANLHLWWNRSPIESSRALLHAAVSDADDNATEEIIRIAKGDKEPSTQLLDSPIVVDQFAGSGALTLAAAEEGLPVVGGDLNSLAVVITKATAEIPSLFADRMPVHPDAEAKLFYGLDGFAEDIHYYGEWVANEAAKRLKKSYPKVRVGNKYYVPKAWIWARNAECPNPACKCRVPLASSFTLSKSKNREYWAEPVQENGETNFVVHEGICPEEKETNKIGNLGAKFRCPYCGELLSDAYVKRKGKKNQLGMQLMAVCLESENGRTYAAPSKGQIKAAEIPVTAELPIGDLPNNTRWFSPPGFGQNSYVDLYTQRQLLMLTTISDLIKDVKEKVHADAVSAGMEDNDIHLKDRGTGALAYSEAIAVYLSLVLNKLTNYQSTVCTWDNRKGNIRAAFTRQAIPMTWTFAEGNPFSDVTGNYDTLLQNVVDTVSHLPYHNAARVIQCDAVKMEYPKNSILFTELPFYDNVGYADLSDYFYIWMRRTLKDIYPDLFEKVVTSKEELSSIPEHFEGNQDIAKFTYEQDIHKLFKNFYESASEEYPSIVFYKYSKEDDAALSSGSNELLALSPIENILDSIIQAGFGISATWPVRTELPNEKYDSVRIAIVFRKVTTRTGQITRRGFVTVLKKEMAERMGTSFSKGIDEYDIPIAGLGVGLSIFTEYVHVLNADGSKMNIHDALQIIKLEVDDYLLNLSNTIGNREEN